MTLYRYRITPRSAFATPLRSDTLYGHLLWRAAERYGAERVTELIEAFAGDSPPFRLSSAFPRGCLPMPSLPPLARSRFRATFAPAGGTELIQALQQYKRFRKLTWIQAERLFSTGISQTQLFRHWQAKPQEVEPPQQWFRTAEQPHNSIDRASGKVLAQGGLHFSRATWYTAGSELDLYVETEQPELFEELFTELQRSGYGADSSTGKGQFVFVRDTEFDAARWPQDGNARLLLSLCAATDMRAVRGYWKTEVKRGRAWSGFGERNPFKKPFLALSEGSVLTAMPEGGFVLRDLHPTPEIVQVLTPVTLPLQLEVAS